MSKSSLAAQVYYNLSSIKTIDLCGQSIPYTESTIAGILEEVDKTAYSVLSKDEYLMYVRENRIFNVGRVNVDIFEISFGDSYLLFTKHIFRAKSGDPVGIYHVQINKEPYIASLKQQ